MKHEEKKDGVLHINLGRCSKSTALYGFADRMKEQDSFVITYTDKEDVTHKISYARSEPHIMTDEKGVKWKRL